MGWADNILLAMGPLGIMTIVVSAIRVGRVKMLKAMVGRARESQSDAEQELLSSTSDDVCELWSGHEIVRVMGQPAGMKTLIVFDGTVHDLKSALGHRILEDPGLEDDVIDTLTAAAPNLALNVRNATAPSWELWTWAAIGIILQLIAVIIPGIATYFWQWSKAGVKVQDYGYPCFVIGTTLVVIGTMVCGHVIEGITVEHNFTKNRDEIYFGSQSNAQSNMQVLRLQRACTVSDQHFSSYAIFNNEDNYSIRTSRLDTEAHYSTLAAIASLVSVVGFIIQFVGLRALHWSATILQLGITIIMTGIRAWARRGLASDPITHIILDSHEIAWLTLYILSNGEYARRLSPQDLPETHDTHVMNNVQLMSLQDSQETPKVTDGTVPHDPESDDNRFWDISFHQDLQVANELIWEPIIGYDSYQGRAMRILRDTGAPRASEVATPLGFLKGDLYMFQQLFSPLRLHGPIMVDLKDSPPLAENDDALQLYEEIASFMPANNAVLSAAISLTSVVERVMNMLCDVKAVVWKKDGIQITQTKADEDGQDPEPRSTRGYDDVDDVSWGFSFSVRMPSDNVMQARQLYFRTKKVNEENNTTGRLRRWQLQNRDSIAGVLSLWLYSMAKRRTSIERLYSSIAKFRKGEYNDIAFGRTGRIVGTGLLTGRNGLSHPLSPWLGVRISEYPFPNGLNINHERLSEVPSEQITWFLGMFLSPIEEAGEPSDATADDNINFKNGGVLVIQTRDDSSLEMKFAQELFSLFMLAMANNIGEVLGTTTQHGEMDELSAEFSQPLISRENSVFNAIANEVVNGGLAHDTVEAYSLIIPAFHKFNLLPIPTTQSRDRLP